MNAINPIRMSHEERRKRRDEMRAMVESGKSLAEVSEIYGVTTETVRRACGMGTRALIRQQIVQAAKEGMHLADIAAKFGKSHDHVRQVCLRAGIKFPRLAQSAPRISWLAVDWSKNDSELGREWGLSSERFRQMRKKLGKPEADFKNSSGELARAVKAIADHPDPYRVATTALAASAGVCVGTIAKAMRLVGVPRRPDRRAKKLPWTIVNWDLPNVTIARIWGVSHAGVANHRCVKKMGPMKWNGRNAGTLVQDPEFLSAIEAEAAKAAKWKELHDTAPAPAPSASAIIANKFYKGQPKERLERRDAAIKELKEEDRMAK